jgi:uncharacterized repeat protein (TIGR02543 family)
VSEAAQYEVWIDNNSDFSSPEALENVSTTSFTPPAPLADGTYYWRVRVIDAAGNLGVIWSDVWWLRIDNTIGIPVLVEPEAGACENDNRPTFRWQPVLDLSPPVVYRLQIDNDPDFSSPLYDNINIVDNGLEIENELPEDNYYWRVWAVDNLGNSENSSSRRVTIDITPPVSSVNPIAPYWQTSAILSIEVTASDAFSGVKRIELWYRYSPDNLEWGSWTLISTKTSPPWDFDFVSPEGDGYYEFYSVAVDNAGNREVAPSKADALCAVDTQVSAPALNLPADRSHFKDNTPTFDWFGVPDLSGPLYTLEIDNDGNFSSPLRFENLDSSSLILQPENSLSLGTHFWRVQTIDRAGNASDWSEVWVFWISAWRFFESWGSEFRVPVSWEILEEWRSAVKTHVNWRLIESWRGKAEVSNVFIDNYDWEFAQGGHENTENIENSVRLAAGESDGRFTSRVFDAGWIVHWENLNWVENEPSAFVQENDNVTSIDNLSNSTIVDADNMRLSDDNPTQISENADNRLEIIFTIDGIARGYDNYTIILEARRSSAGVTPDNFYVYILENRLGTEVWRLIGTIQQTTDQVFTLVISGDNIDNYIGEPPGDNIRVKIVDTGNQDNQTDLFIDHLIVMENITYESYVRLQVRVSFDGTTWSENLGPDGTPITYFDTPPVSLENIPDNQYIQYVVYFLSENSQLLSGENGPTLFEVSIWLKPTFGTPDLVSPDNDTVIRDNTPTLTWVRGLNAIWHRLVVAIDPGFSLVVDNILLPGDSTSWEKPQPGYPDGVYYWKVITITDNGNELPSEVYRFTLSTEIAIPELLEPENTRHLRDNTPLLRWNIAENADNYRLEIYDTPNFTSLVYENDNITENSHELPVELSEGLWYWRVRGFDNWGNVSEWSEVWQFRIDITHPGSVWLLSPADGSRDNDNTPFFKWQGGSDDFFLAYRLVIDNDPNFSSPRYDNDNLLPRNLELPLENSLNVEGIWYWRVAAIDLAGNITWSENWSFVYDNAPPSAPNNLTPDNNAFLNNSTITFVWSEVANGGVENYSLQVDNDNDFSSPIMIAPLTDNSISYTLVVDGVWYWRVRAFDRVGNGSGWSGWFKLTVDTSVPMAPDLFSPANGSFNTSGTVSFKWSEVIDVWAPGFENYTIQMARDEGFTSIYHENSVDDNSYTHTFTEDNIFYWRVRSRDNAGNVSGWSENWRLIVDTTPPGAPSLVSPDNEASLNIRNPTLDWTPVYDPLSGVSYRVQVDNENSFAFPEYDKFGVVQSQHSLENTLGEGKWYWRVRAVDGAGNPSSWSENWWFKIDVRVSAPLLLEPASQATISDPTPVFRWSEPEASVTYTLVIDNDSDFSSPIYENSLLADNLDNFDQHPENGLPDGLWYWRVHVVDAAGNENISSHGWFNVDTAVGIPVLLFPENQKVINDNTPRFDWRAVPDISGVSYTIRVMRLDNTLAFEQTSIQTSEFTLPSGNALPDNFYKWCVKAADGVGNENWSENWVFELDTVAPALKPSLISPALEAFVNTSCPTFAWSSVPGADNYQLQIAADQAFTTIKQDISNIRDNTYTLSKLEALPDGIYYWRVRAGDNAGNVGPWSDNRKLTVDTEAPSAPSLFLPELGAYENDNTPIFSWSPVSDSSGVVYHLQIDDDPDFPSPRYDNDQLMDNLDNFDQHPENELPDGVWYWRVRATDNAKNSSTWVARWVLIDTQPPRKPLGLTPSRVLRDDPAPSFDWLGVPNSSGVTYELQIATDNVFENLVINVSDLLLSEYQSPALPENLYYWRVKALDRAGNQGLWSDNLRLVLDFAGPLPRENLFWLWVHDGTENEDNRSITPCEINFVNDLTPRLWFLLEDRGIGLADNFTVELDNSAEFPSPVQLALIKSYLENRDGAYILARAENALDPLAEGHWYLRLRAWDNIPQAYGGPHFTELVYHFVVDLTPPPEAPEWLENSWYNDNTPSFSWTEIWDNEEENRKVQRYELRITRGSSVNENIVYDNAWIYDNVVGDNTVIHTIPEENALAECENYYRWVRGIDNAGNPGPWSVGRWFGVDVTPPSSSVASPTQAQASAPFQVTASASDYLSGVENVELWYRYSSDGTSWTGWASFGTDNDGGDGWSWSFTASEGKGLYQFYCTACDVAGNRESAPATADLEVKLGYTITVSISPAGSGTASASPTIALPGETVILSATPASGYSFSSWSGYLSTTSNPASFSMPASSVSVTANFAALQTYTLTISVNPQEGGTTSPSPGQHSYTVGSTLSVTASPATGYKFVNWSGDISENSATIQVTMNSNLSITANFEPKSYTITVSADPADGGDVSVSPSATVTYGTSVRVTATPASGYEFAGWEGHFTDNENSSKTFTMPAEDITLTAKFRWVGVPTYRVSVGAMPHEGGEVTISPSSEVSAGTRVTVTAKPAPGYEFERWTGDFVSTENPYEFTMPSNDVLLIARFKEVSEALPIAWIGVGVAAAAGFLIFFKLRAGVGIPKEKW